MKTNKFFGVVAIFLGQSGDSKQKMFYGWARLAQIVSMVSRHQWLVHWPLVLEVPGSISAAGEEKHFDCVRTFLSFSVICRDDTKICVPSFWSRC